MTGPREVAQDKMDRWWEEKTPQWEDLTSFIHSQCESLPLGTMVTHPHNFSLYHSMTAIELGDPKMDPRIEGLVLHTIQKSLKTQHDTQQEFRKRVPWNLSELTSLQTLEIMDSLLQTEVAFYEGCSLRHCVYSSWFMYVPELLQQESQLLYVFCESIKAACEVYYNIATAVDIYEEEDFHPQLYGIQFKGDTNLAEILRQLQQLIDQQTDEKVSSRLKLRKHWLSALETFSDLDSRIKACAKSKPALLLIRELLDSGSFLESDGVPPRMQSSASSDWPIGFDPLISKSFITHSPPKLVELVSFKLVINFFRKTVEGLIITADFAKLPPSKVFSDLDVATSFYWNITDLLLPQSFLRFASLLVLGNEKQFLHGDSLRASVKRSLSSFCSTGKAYVQLFSSSSSKSEEYKIFEAFLDRIVPPISQLFRLLAQNRSRQHSKIPSLIVDWAILENDAATVDQFGKQALSKIGLPDEQEQHMYKHPFFAWVFNITSRLVAQHVFLGFEMNLYGIHEIGYLYWFLEYVLDLRLQTKYYSNQHPFDLIVSPEKLRGKKSSSSKGKNSKNKSASHLVPKEVTPPVTDVFLLEAMRDISRAVHKIFEGLRRKGLYSPPESLFEYTTGENQYLQRLGWIRQLPQPALPNYSDFTDQVVENKELDPDALFADAVKTLKQAKSLLDAVLANYTNSGKGEYCYVITNMQSVNIKSLIKVTVMNSVFVLSLQRSINKIVGKVDQSTSNPLHKSIALSVDYSTHLWFPTFSIESK